MSHLPSCEVTAQVAAASASAPPDGDGLSGLVLRLAEEMAAAWRQGERPTVEEFLDRYPELRARPDATLPLICEEICLREDYGDNNAETTVLSRFASSRERVEHLLI